MITPEFLSSAAAEVEADAKSRLAMQAITRCDMLEVLRDRKRGIEMEDHTYSVKITSEGKATSQKSSGRCWMFAALNVLRVPLIRKLSLPTTFEFSQSYMFFFDKLEKANYFLDRMIQLAGEPVDGRLISYLLKSPVEDGGQLDMFINLVSKYGVV